METDSSRKLVAIYARVSSEEQREGQTIDSQVAELERFAKDKGWEVTGVYKDEGWSGGILARPELDHLRDDASKGRYSAVLINDVDRLARDVTHLGVIKRDLESRGVQVVFRKLPSEDSPTHNLMVNILGSFAEFERELIADRTRRGKRHKVEVRKQYVGSIAPFGYRYIRKDMSASKEGILEINPEEAATVKQIYAWVGLEGLSERKVVDRLNQSGVVPRKGSHTWGKSSVARILRSEVYAGVWYFNKHQSCEPAKRTNKDFYRRSLKSSSRLRSRTEWLPVEFPEHLRIVSRKLWERAQRQLDQNTAFSPRNSKHSYLLSSMVRCAGCGARCVGNPCHGRFYYRCFARCKKIPTVKEDDLNTAVWEAIEGAMMNPRLILESVQRLNHRRASAAIEQRDGLSDHDKAVKQINAEESRLLEAYRLGLIAPAQLGSELEKLASRRKSFEGLNAIQGAGQQVPSMNAIKATVYDYCETVVHRLATLTFEGRQRFLRLLVKEVVFDGSLATIRGVIPAYDGDEKSDRGPLMHTVLASDVGKIAGTDTASHARNPTCAADLSGKRESRLGLPFVIERPVLRSDERKKKPGLKVLAA